MGKARAFNEVPEYADILNKAKKITDDTFFDYSNVNLFEQKVMKRVMPYYTFFSRNLNWHLNNIFDNTAGMSKLLKIHQNLGDRPTDDQRKDLPEWLLKYNPRVMGEDELGNLKLIYAPSISVNDALNMISDPNGDALNKIHPLLKMSYEQIANEDLFLGKSLSTEGYWGGKKPVFSGALVPKMLGANVEVNPKTGSLYTKDSGTARLLNIKSNALPIPILDTLAGLHHDISTGRKTPLEAISGKLPIKLRTVSKKSREFNRRKNERKYVK